MNGTRPPITPEDEAPLSAQQGPPPKKIPLSIRWIFLGALILVVGVKFGSGLIVAHIVEKNEELAEAYRRQNAKMERGQQQSDEEKNAFRSLVFGNPTFVAGIAAMLLLMPFGVGVAIGRITATKRDAAIAVAAGMTMGFAIERVPIVPLLISAVVYTGVGMLAGLVGKRFAMRRAAP